MVSNTSRLSLDPLSPQHGRHLQLQGCRVLDHCRAIAIRRIIEDTGISHPKVQLVSQSLGIFFTSDWILIPISLQTLLVMVRNMNLIVLLITDDMSH